MKFDLHFYATVRIKIADVDGADQRDAIAKAEAIVIDYLDDGGLNHKDITFKSGHKGYSEDAEHITDVLVDECGDRQYIRTIHYCGNEQIAMVPEGKTLYTIKETGQAILLPSAAVFTTSVIEAMREFGITHSAWSISLLRDTPEDPLKGIEVYADGSADPKYTLIPDPKQAINRG